MSIVNVSNWSGLLKRAVVILALGIPSLFAQLEESDGPLKFYKNHFVTGDYVVGGKGLRGLGVLDPTSQAITGSTQSRYATGTINITNVPANADLVASMRAQLRVRDAMNATASLINRIETMRKQLEDQRKKSATDAEAVAAVDAMDNKLLDVELKLLSRTDLHSDDKWYVESYKIYLNLLWLGGEIGGGASDVAGGADYRPTDAALRLLDMIEKDLAAAQAAYATVVERDVPAFNKANPKLAIR